MTEGKESGANYSQEVYRKLRIYRTNGMVKENLREAINVTKDEGEYSFSFFEPGSVKRLIMISESDEYGVFSGRTGMSAGRFRAESLKTVALDLMTKEYGLDITKPEVKSVSANRVIILYPSKIHGVSFRSEQDFDNKRETWYVVDTAPSFRIPFRLPHLPHS